MAARAPSGIVGYSCYKEMQSELRCIEEHCYVDQDSRVG